MPSYIRFISLDIKKQRKHLQSFMAYSEIVGSFQVTGAGPAYNSTTGRRVVLVVYSNVFGRKTHDCTYDN
jgi:hypothetical protein